MKVVQILLLLFIVETSHASENCTNLALRGKASQSSRFDSVYSAASNAIDGNDDTHFTLGSCTQTAVNKEPWWRVDLLNHYMVTSLHIIGRLGPGGDLDEARIKIGDTKDHDNVVAVIPKDTGINYTHHFDIPVEGRYVTVSFEGEKALSLCEVEVCGYHAPTGENLASCGKATQSSINEHRTAALAIDGNRNAASDMCMQTDLDDQPWLRLDLGKTHKISSVNVTNRIDHYERLNGTEIRIGDSLDNEGRDNPRCAVIEEIGPGETMGFDCHGMDGQYVVLVNPKPQMLLHVCEVEVYGWALD